MSNTEIVNETADIDDIELHEVYVYIACLLYTSPSPRD